MKSPAHSFTVASLITLACCASGGAFAGRPLAVDDANVNDVHAGHVETYFQRQPGSSNTWTIAPAWSLHKHIATARLRALNAAAPADASKLFRPWGERATPASPPLVSDDDDPPELLVHVPFDGLVKITAFSVVSCGSGEAGGRGETTAPPTRVRLFVNRDDLDFDSLASAEPTQEFEVAGGGAAEVSRVEYPCRPSKFSGVYSVDVHFPGNSGGSGGGGGGSSRCNTRIDFLGFKGTHTQGKREAVVAVYESRAMPSDHKAAEEGIGGAADVS